MAHQFKKLRTSSASIRQCQRNEKGHGFEPCPGSSRKGTYAALELKAIAHFHRHLPRAVEVRPAEAVGLVYEVAMVGEVQRGETQVHVLADRFANHHVEGGVRGQV